MSELVQGLRPEFIGIVLNQKGRSCFGRLYFGGDALSFVCLKDESAAAAAAGNAAARQFGLIGALAGAAVGAVKANQRDKAIAEVLAAQEGMSLEQRMTQHPLSRTFKRDELKKLNVSNWSGTWLQTSEGKVPIMQLAADDQVHLRQWFEEKGVEVFVSKGLSRRAKLSLILAPVALVIVYVLAAGVYATRKASHDAEVRAQYGAMVELAEKTWAGLERPVGVDLATACASKLAGRDAKDLVGYVGRIPGQDKYDSDYPMVVTTSGDYVFDDRVPDDRWRSGFGDHFTSILTEAPTDWERRVNDCYPRCSVINAKTLVVTRVHALQNPGAGAGRAAMSSRVLDLATGEELCAGDTAAVLPGYSDREGVRDASLLGVCSVGGDALCTAVAKNAKAVRR